ncbi:MFS transporter [Novosphingobium sp.]|uniref:MFS transporter n=1 Tax=Novosphingobium sp. TaxID=1874826 RepID=UPI001ED2EC2D|nr:MFS transporter [Novosphingobium sp.]MBK9009851.1 MFS transporter [Novosphingobium sp.]
MPLKQISGSLRHALALSRGYLESLLKSRAPVTPDAFQPATFATKCAYGLGQASEGMKTNAFSLFTLFYYNQILGLDGALTGMALGIALVIDAIVDPLVGWLSDSWRSRFGRRHPFMYASILPLALGFSLLFNPIVTSQEGLFIWLIVFACISRVSISMFFIPHVALGAELSVDFQERTSIVGYRQVFSILGGATVVLLGFGVFLADQEIRSGALDHTSYGAMGITLAVVMASCMLISALGTQNRVPYLYQVPDGAPRHTAWGILGSMYQQFRGILGNRSFCALFFGVLILYVMVGVDAALYLHVTTFFWQITSTEQMYFWAIFSLGCILGGLSTTKLSEWFEKRTLLIFGTVGWAFFQMLPTVLRVLEALPENRDSALFPFLAAVSFAKGLVVVQAWIMYGSMMADVADEYDLETGRRSEGILFAAVSFSNQAMTGLGTIIAGFILSFLEWPTGAHVDVSTIDPSKVALMGLFYGPAIGGFALFSMLFFLAYGIDKRRHTEIRAMLQSR